MSPKLDARTDQQKYATWLRQGLNIVPYRTGGFTRRVGTQFMAATKYAFNNTGGHNYAAITKDFVFSPATTFTLEFGHLYVRFYSNGAQVKVNSATAWSNSTAYVIGNYVSQGGYIYYCIQNNTNEAPAAFGASNTWWVWQTIYEIPSPYTADAGSGSIYSTVVHQLTFCQINDVVFICHPDFPPYALTQFGTTDWTLEEVVFSAPALLDQNATDTTITPSATTGSITLTASAPSWVTATWYSPANSVLQGGVIYDCVTSHVSGTFATDLANGVWQSVNIFNSQQIGGTWQIADLRSSAYLEVDGTAVNGNSLPTGFATWTDTGGGSGTTSTTPAYSSSIQCLGGYEVHTYGVWVADIGLQRSLDGGSTWDTVTTVTGRSDRNVDLTGTAAVVGLYRFELSVPSGLSPVAINPGATFPRIVFECDDAFLYGSAQITAVASAYSATATVVAEISSTTATEYWSEAAWSNYRGFPQALTTFQQRMIYASSGFEPQRIWGTVTNDIENFALGDQTQATDAFAFDLNAPSRGPISWLTAQTDLFAGFSGAEWIINSGSTTSNGVSSGSAITPSNINAFENGTYGSAPNVQPTIVGNAVFFVQRNADAIRQMLFSIYTDKYMSQDLTMLADFLFASGIVQLAYQARWRHQGIIWAVTQQGTLCGLTYDLDQEVFGWSMAQTGYGQVDANGNPLPNDNGFESVCVLPANGSSDDEVWVVANRLINGVQTRFIERINPNNWEETFVGAPTPPYANLPDAFYVDCGFTFLNPGGPPVQVVVQNFLNGRYVVGLADGAPFGPILVTNGVATLPNSIPSTVAKVQIGLPIKYAGQAMRIDADVRAGNTQGLKKQVSDMYLRVWNSCGGSISNGTAQLPTWVSGGNYTVGQYELSPLTGQAYQCVNALTNDVVDPSKDPTNWVQSPLPTYNAPVPIPYTPNSANPFAVPVLVTTPKNIRVTPALNPWIDEDPQIVITGNDALPLTVLGYFLHYDIIGAP